MPAPATYAFLDLVGTFFHPLAGEFLLSGELGVGQVTISKTDDNTAIDVSGDGASMVSFMPSDRGTVTIEMQQTSTFHKFLLAWYNQIKGNAVNHDVSNWATASLSLRLISDGSQHNISGIAPGKPADKTYAKQGQNVTWALMAADVESL